MAEKKKGGLINRLIMGSEKSEGYARAHLPSNRWELFWDIFKGRFGKLVIINLLTLLFFIPLIALLFFRYVAIINYGTIYPFSQPFGVGYQAPPSVVGYSESIIFNVNLTLYILMPVALAIAAVGVSGGAYVIRNMVWTEGIFVANDFWRGIKQNFKSILTIALVFSLVFYLTTVSVALVDQMLAMGTSYDWLFIICKVISYFVLIFYGIMTMHMITMTVTYELKFSQLLKNSFLFTIGLAPQNIFFLFLGIIPFLLTLLGGIFMGIALILIILMGISLLLLIWTDYCQWIYDRYVNDKVPGAQKNRGIYEKIKESDSESLKQYRDQLASGMRSSLNSRPIKPITDDEIKLAELPASYSRSDIEKLNASRQAIYDDNARYIEEHKDDPEFQPTEEEAQLQKQASEREKRIEAAKKELAKRNKKR